MLHIYNKKSHCPILPNPLLSPPHTPSSVAQSAATKITQKKNKINKHLRLCTHVQHKYHLRSCSFKKYLHFRTCTQVQLRLPLYTCTPHIQVYNVQCVYTCPPTNLRIMLNIYSSWLLYRNQSHTHP